MNDPMSKAIEQSLAEAALAVYPNINASDPMHEAALIILEDIRRATKEILQLRTEVAQLRQEREQLIISHDDGHANYASERIRRDAAESRLAALTAALEAIVCAYDAYRERGVRPAPNQYQLLVISIEAGRLAALRTPEAKP